jgi:hypothetical protein
MKLKSIGIGLLIVVILFIGIRVFNHFVSNKEYVEVPLIVPDTVYQEIGTKRDSLQLVIDSILNTLNNTNQYEKEFDKAISDTDSIAILERFLYLVSKPIRVENPEIRDEGR